MVAWMDTTLDAAAPADTAGDSETLFFGNGIRPLLDFQSALPAATNLQRATLFLGTLSAFVLLVDTAKRWS